MLPISHKSIFKNRWWALAWSAGIVWSAVEFAGAQPGATAADNGATADANGSGTGTGTGTGTGSNVADGTPINPADFKDTTAALNRLAAIK